ncbi:MAG: ABC transporter permease [Thermodesulfobacteria bacterium]|nr:ABC transporter permease [Thermodesulfobacteriota bacterium]
MFRVWYRNFKVWLKHIQASLIGNLGQPFLFLLAFGFGLGRSVPEIEGMTYLQFIAPGLVTSAVMYSAAFEATYGSYTRLSTQGTFEAILMTPINVFELAMGEIIWGATKGLIAGLIMLATLPLFGVVPSAWSIFMVPLLFLEGVIFAAFGLIMTAIATNYDFFNYFTSLVITPLFLFSGIFFSLKALAPSLKLILMLLPLSNIVDLSRMLCYGRLNGIEPIQLELIIVALYTLVSTWVAVILLKRRMIQ